MTYELHHGDCLDVLRGMADCSVDSIVTDPPYGLSFMGKRWDYDVPAVEVWSECLRVLKPGGHLLAFAGTRTQHRMAVRIEDAGFEIRDMIAWLYGAGFPKSLNVAKAIESGSGRPEDIRRMQLGDAYEPSGRGRVNYDHGAASVMDAGAPGWEPSTDAARQWAGWGTALKPALEPITVARKPLVGTVAGNVLEHGTGALNIDGCRVACTDVLTAPQSAPHKRGAGAGEFCMSTRDTDAMHAAQRASIQRTMELGRWPANVIHDGSDEVLSKFPDSNGSGPSRILKRGQREHSDSWGMADQPGSLRDAGTGSAARFFYCAKASKADRGHGNNHPTVKPTDLMRYLCRLVTPPGGLVLDPFAGSGSTGKAAVLEGFRFVGIEREAEYVAIARARIASATCPKRAHAPAPPRERKTLEKACAHAQSDLFGAAP